MRILARMRNRLIGNVVAAAVVAAFAISAQGNLLVSEFIADPSGTDADREWIEIFNQSPLTLDLTGYKVGDEETQGGDEGMFSFPTGTTMAPGQVFVIANKATGFFSLYGKNPDFEITGTDPAVPNMVQYSAWASRIDLAIANTGDHAGVLDPFDQWVDGSNHGSASFFFPSPALLGANESYERTANVDTDTAADWTVRVSGSATPGITTLTVIPEPSALALGLLAASLFVMRRRA